MNYLPFSQAVDIIVFPEYGMTGSPIQKTSPKPLIKEKYRKYYLPLSTSIPAPEEVITPCDSGSTYTQVTILIISRYGVNLVLHRHS